MEMGGQITTMTNKKELSEEEFRNIVVEHMTLNWLKQNGLDPADPKTPAIEIDENEESSQLVAWKLTAEEAYDSFIEAIQKIEEMGYDLQSEEEEEESDPVADFSQDNFGNRTHHTYHHPPQRVNTEKSRLTKTNTTFIFLDTDPGKPMYVADVREWLAEVDSLGIPDTEEVEGSLFVDYDTPFETTERSECLYCGDKTDILVTLHDCKAGEEDQ